MVKVNGEEVTAQTAGSGATIGICPQHNVLFNALSVRQHLEFYAKLKRPDFTRVGDLMVFGCREMRKI